MTITLLQTVAGLALLYVGGELLVRGAAALALRVGISPLAIGLTVVAFGTSAPELVVSLDAALAGANDIAVGNVVGSNIANLALVLGFAALIRPPPVQARILRLDVPLMILSSLVLLGMLSDGRVSRLEGGLLVLAIVGYVAFTLWLARQEPEGVRQEFATLLPRSLLSVRGSSLLVILGALVLVGGGHLLVGAAVEVAAALGVSQAAIGLTIVAVGTSLPELATSVVAAARGQSDIALGNVVGSNIFNVLGILGVTATVTPLARGGIGWASLWVMLGVAFVLLPLPHARLRLARSGGLLLLAGYAAYVAWLLAG